MEFEKVEVNSERWFDLTLLKNEEFRDIKETKNKYQISNYGRIKSKKNNKILSIKNSNNWYLTKLFYIEGKRITLRPHRLVAMAFIPNPDNLPEVDHLDFNKQNCRIDNLRWVTRKENIKHNIVNNKFFYVSKYNKNRINKKFGRIIQYDLQMNKLGVYNNTAEASRQTGVCSRNIALCINHKEGRKQAGGYKWLCEREVIQNGVKI